MMEYIIMCRSVTSAQHCARILEASLIRASIKKAPRELTAHGCGYCVALAGRIGEAVGALKKKGVGFGKVYRLNEDGKYTEVRT